MFKNIKYVRNRENWKYQNNRDKSLLLKIKFAIIYGYRIKTMD